MPCARLKTNHPLGTFRELKVRLSPSELPYLSNPVQVDNYEFSFLMSRLYCQMLTNIQMNWIDPFLDSLVQQVFLGEVWHRHCHPGKFSLSNISQDFLEHLKLPQIFSMFCQGISGKRFIQLFDVRNCGRIKTTVSYWVEEVKPTTSFKNWLGNVGKKNFKAWQLDESGKPDEKDGNTMYSTLTLETDPCYKT